MPARTKPTAARTKPPWQNTWLWETLEKRAKEGGNDHAREFLPTLTEWMKKLDTVLQKAGTAPLDFTLHDAEHALRVAQRIEQLLTSTTRRNLSDYELALLLAAYGHDIGMSPERKKVSQHHRHLFGHDTGLTDEEKARYQEFLDNYADQPVPLPLTNSLAHLNLADELTAYYVRERHNHWSGEWLREKLTGDFAFLPQVVEILIRLCASHHWGFDRLAAIEFQPFLSTGPQPQLIHLRYLACILRLADILENDPERAPDVIMRHRSIGERGRSLVHWQKDHALSIDLRGDRLHFQARPCSAVAHKALLQLADWIDHELQGIAAFGARLPQQWRVGNKIIAREWHLAPALTRDIQPVPGTYEYIEGAFRPNTSRLLQLLSNEQLYGRHMVAVRELLQNAFDAVREKIARLRLASHITDPADPKWEPLLGDQEKVTLTLRPDAQGHWHLICEDTGVGLTKALITGHLLISGQNRRHAILELERQCEAKGFRPGLTGQFGIGVLSYFMLAEEVTLQTTRYQYCQDNDAPGWSFTTRGVGSFGELRKLDTSPFPTGGSLIDWQLREDRIENPDDFAVELLEYLKDTLIRIPCRFEFKTEGLPGGDLLWERGPGWVKTGEDWKQIGPFPWPEPEQLYHAEKDYLSALERDKWDTRKARYPAELATARDSLRCEFLEVPLPGGVGLARLALRYFELEKGRCLRFPPERNEDEDFSLTSWDVAAWRGMNCDLNVLPPVTPDTSEADELRLTFGALSVEFDLTAADRAALAVSREGVNFPRATVQAWRQRLEEVGWPWSHSVLGVGSGSYYQEVNLAWQGRPLTLQEGCGWHHDAGAEPFRPLRRPFALMVKRRDSQPRLRNAAGESVALLHSFATWVRPVQDGFELRAALIHRLGKPLHLPAVYWPQKAAAIAPGTVLLPPQWRDIGLVLGFDWRMALNPKHPVIRLLTAGEQEEIEKGRQNYFNFWTQLDAAATPGAAALAFAQTALHFVFAGFSDRWEGYQEQRAGHLQHLWHLVAAASGTPRDELRLLAISYQFDVLLSPKGGSCAMYHADEPSLLPEVTDSEWLLCETDGEK